jgi:hypothetical protein
VLPPPTPFPRTNRTSLVPPLVLSGDAASLSCWELKYRALLDLLFSTVGSGGDEGSSRLLPFVLIGHAASFTPY